MNIKRLHSLFMIQDRFEPTVTPEEMEKAIQDLL